MWLSKGRRTLVAITLRLCTARFWLMELDRDQVHSLGEKQVIELGMSLLKHTKEHSSAARDPHTHKHETRHE